jgi:hypothetical protein
LNRRASRRAFFAARHAALFRRASSRENLFAFRWSLITCDTSRGLPPFLIRPMSLVPDSRIRRVTTFDELVTTPFADGINALCWPRALPGDFAEVVALLSDPKRRASRWQTPCLGPSERRGSDLPVPAPESGEGLTPCAASIDPPSLSDEPNEGMISIEPSTLESLLADDLKRSAISGQPSAPSSDHSTLNPRPSTAPAAPSSHVTGHTSLSVAGRKAIEILLEDWQLLRALNRDPVLNLIHGYPRDEDGGPVPTDVFSFHADSAPVPADTWLCTYHGPPSEGLRNEDAVRKIDVPAIRAELLKLHGGPDDASFAEFLSENHYDLHYAPRADAPSKTPSRSKGCYSFGLFNLWRIACDYPDAPVPPCIHRAPMTKAGDPPRLLLIS